MVGLGKHEGDPRHSKLSHSDKVPMADGDASLIDAVYETILNLLHLLICVLNLYQRGRIFGRQGYFYPLLLACPLQQRWGFAFAIEAVRIWVRSTCI